MPEQFDAPVGLSAVGGTWNFSIDSDGNLELRSNSPSGGGESRMRFQDDTGQVYVGTAANPASLDIFSMAQFYDTLNNVRLQLSAEEQSIQMFNDVGIVTSLLDSDANLRLGSNGASGDVLLFPNSSTDIANDGQATASIMANRADMTLGGNGANGDLYIREGEGRNTIHASASNAWLRVGITGNEGDLEVQDGSGRRVMHMDGASAALRVGAQGNEGDILAIDGAGREVFHINSQSAWLRVGANGNEGDLEVQDGSGRRVMHMDGASAALRVGAQGNEGDILAIDGAGREVFHINSQSAWLRVGANGNEGDLEVQDGSGRRVMHMDGNHAVLRVGAAGNEGDVIVRDGNGAETIHLNGSTGDIILRNADAAEDFTVTADSEAEPGMVMVLTDDGTIEPSTQPYDTRVVGVVAGAGNYRPAIVMDRREAPDEHRKPISIMGKVSVKADATQASIQIGDMLTTSSTQGMAMKASDPLKAFGAVCGKALTSLREGIGTVDMLISMR